jgi:glyoxylase-like metal-dependent hydrolase (beta-lactamase superfamily II)
MLRKPSSRLYLALALASLAARLAAELPPERAYSLSEVGDRVYAFVSPETSGPIPSGNVVAVVGNESVLVVDSGRFPTLARRMIADIRTRTDKPVRWLVHTHWHLDHIVGDGEFRKAFPQAIFVATDFTRRKMVEKQVPYVRDIEKNDKGYIEYLEGVIAKGKRDDGTDIPAESIRYLKNQIADIRLELSEVPGATIVAPDVTFENELTIHLGGRDARVLFLGKGNTAGDTVVWVPDARVVATGDLLVAPVPYGYGAHPGDWIETLDRLMKLDAAAIVPGHGSVMHDWSYAKRIQDVLGSVRSQVADAVKAGATAEQAFAKTDVDRFEKEFSGGDGQKLRAFRDYFVRDAINRSYQEAKGEMAEE